MSIKKPLEVREFEKITCETEDKIKYGDHRLSESRFKELEEFIYEFSNEDKAADILDFMSIGGFKRNVGKIISLKNYVGLIQLGSGYQIQILPKISFDSEDEDNVKAKAVFLKMLRCLKSFPGKVFTGANLNVAKMNLYEIFINMYLQEVRQLVKRGIKSSYIEQEDNLKFYKGKLLVNEQIKYNLVHKERFYVRFDEYNVNRAENRLVKATLIKLSKLTTSAENSKEIRQLLTAFEMVEESFNYEKDFSKVDINRNTKDYELLMQWTKVFLLNKSFTTFSGKNNSKSLLFPMESVYESYVAYHMKKVFGPLGWNVSAQDIRHHLFEKPTPQFRLRPDIVMRKGKGTVVLDTKWKRLINNPGKNYGISQADMYQMYAYSKKYKTSEIWLLYPITDEMRNHEPIEYDSGDNTFVRIHFIDVDKIEENLEELKIKIPSFEG